MKKNQLKHFRLMGLVSFARKEKDSRSVARIHESTMGYDYAWTSDLHLLLETIHLHNFGSIHSCTNWMFMAACAGHTMCCNHPNIIQCRSCADGPVLFCPMAIPVCRAILNEWNKTIYNTLFCWDMEFLMVCCPAYACFSFFFFYFVVGVGGVGQKEEQSSMH